jgi:hypothetical protein
VAHEELRDINPLAKFVCFKSIVFATWWQGVLIAFIFASPMASHWFPDAATGTLQTSLQDFIICIEVCLLNT